ncbi:unnamed protein product [Amoebophrya sp. A25]|nr:unnamed protein product [Amoebophrya sp. A25]|eukprot:GSA25T00019453001.1
MVVASPGALAPDVGDERQPISVETIEHTLSEIFDFYATRAHSKCSRSLMKSMKFQKMALDADLVDEGGRLTSARVDLIFKKLCGNCPTMTFEQFMNGCVQIALVKYPQENKAHQALGLLYEEHFSKFLNPHAELLQNFDPSFFDEIRPLKEGILTLYQGYFAQETNPHFQQQISSLESSSMKSFLACFHDFEIAPNLVPKPIVLSVFREVMKGKIPNEVFEFFECEDVCTRGRLFTIGHFLLGLYLVGKKLFGLASASSSSASASSGQVVFQLLERMDVSTPGKIIFTAERAKSLPLTTSAHLTAAHRGGASFQFCPESREQGFGGGGGSSSSDAELMNTSKNSGMSHGGQSGQRPLAPSATGNRLHSTQIGSLTHYGGSSSSTSARGTASGQQHPVPVVPDMIRPLGEQHEILISQLFLYYATLGDPLNRSAISSLKFNRFLRDAGLLPAECQGAVTYDHMQPKKRAHRAQALSRQKLSVSAHQPRVNAEAFPNGPPLTQVDVDLIFLQAINWERKKTNSKGQQHRHLLNETSWRRALCDIGIRLYYQPRDDASALGGARGGGASSSSKSSPTTDPHKNSTTTLTPVEASLESLCRKVLQPAAKALDFQSHVDVSNYAVEMGKQQMVDLFHSPNVSEGIAKIFTYYADQSARTSFAKSKWTVGSFLKFCIDFEITEEIPHLPLQRIFQDCAHVESVEGRTSSSELSKLGFQLCLVLIAVKLNRMEFSTLEDQVLALLHKLNHAARTGMRDRPTVMSMSRRAQLFPSLAEPRGKRVGSSVAGGGAGSGGPLYYSSSTSPAVSLSTLTTNATAPTVATLGGPNHILAGGGVLKAGDPQLSERFFRTLRN